jgi:hypothetical protein
MNQRSRFFKRSEPSFSLQRRMSLSILKALLRRHFTIQAISQNEKRKSLKAIARDAGINVGLAPSLCTFRLSLSRYFLLFSLLLFIINKPLNLNLVDFSGVRN